MTLYTCGREEEGEVARGAIFFLTIFFFFAKFIFRTEGAKLILIIEKILLPLKALRNQYRPLLSYILHTGAKKKKIGIKK